MLQLHASLRTVEEDVARPKIGRPRIADAAEIHDYGAAHAPKHWLVRVTDQHDVYFTASEQRCKLRITSPRMNALPIVSAERGVHAKQADARGCRRSQLARQLFGPVQPASARDVATRPRERRLYTGIGRDQLRIATHRIQ